MLRQMKIKKAIGLVLLVIFLLPVGSINANEKSGAGNTGEVEFFYEKTPDPPAKPNPPAKPIINLPQTGNSFSVPVVVFGGIMIVAAGILVMKRRDAHE